MARKVKVDLTGVESFVKCEEGQHIAVVKDFTEEVSQGGAEMLVGKFEVTNGNSTGAVVYNNFVLGEKSLWRLKGFLEVMGMKADGKIVIDLDKIVGKKLIIEVGHEEYNGATKARINDFKKLVAQKAPVDDEDEEEIEDDEEEEETPPPVKKKKKPTPPPVEEEEDDEEEEDEEEDEAPPVKKKKAAPAPAPVKKKAAVKKKVVEEDDEDDWEDD